MMKKELNENRVREFDEETAKVYEKLLNKIMKKKYNWFDKIDVKQLSYSNIPQPYVGIRANIFVDEDWGGDIIMNLVGGLNSSSVDYLDDNKWQEYLYKLKTHLELGLDLRKFLSDGNKEINSMDIFKRFCDEIKDEFEMSNDTLNISYNIERI